MVIRSRNSKQNRQYNGQKKNNKRTNNDQQRIKLKIEQHEPRQKPGVHSCAPEGLAVPTPHVTPVMVLLNDTNIV